jgi:large subunit ribosomal protein L18
MGSKGRKEARIRRKMRVRKKVRGTGDKPRLSVFRSARHIYAQLIDDDSARTIVTMSSMDSDLRTRLENRCGNCRSAALVGEHIAKKALEKGIKQVVFDRNGFLYHGRVKTLADAAREHGLEF